MFRIFIKLLLLCSLSVSLQAQSGLSQQDLISVYPENLAEFASMNTAIEIEFAKPILPKSIHKNTVVLKNANNQRIKGSIGLKDSTTLLFKPNNTLQVGTYKVQVQKVKLESSSRNFTHTTKINYNFIVPDVKSISITPSSVRLIDGDSIRLTVTGLYVDNSTKEILNNVEWIIEDNSIVSIVDNTLTALSDGTTTLQAKFNNVLSDSVQVTAVSLVSVNIERNSIDLVAGYQTTLSVSGVYSDNLVEDISNSVEWIIEDSSVVSISNNVLTGFKEGSTTVEAKYNSVLSTPTTVQVYQEINGYTLPHEPDPVINNSTILGIDLNDNGVRDDIEIFIIKKYKNDHKIVTEIGLQGAKAYQMIVDNPLDTDANHKAINDARDCNSYFRTYAKYFNEPLLTDEYISRAYKKLQLNTKSRVRTYIEYDRQLSGGVFTSTKSGKLKEKCNFDTNSLLGSE